jgi:serine/threonine protein kinase
MQAHAGELVLAAHAIHPHIVPFYGAYISDETSPRICIVSPWMDDGNLKIYLNQNPAASRIHLVSVLVVR